LVKIRLLRAGAKKRPFYRIVAMDERRKRDGRALEFLGTYDPAPDPPRIKVRKEQVAAWVAKGAQLSHTVRFLVQHAPDAPPEEPAAAPAEVAST
jgi:small subunit ribosomal protein S16